MVTPKTFTMIIILPFLLMITDIPELKAQDRYVVKVQTMTDDIIKGRLLYAAGDSIGILKKDTQYVNLFSDRVQLKASKIKSLKIRRVGNAGRGAAVGACVGVVLGAAIGFISYEDPCTGVSFCINFGPESNAMGGGLIGLGVGGIIGALMGASSGEEIIVDADQNKFDAFKERYSSSTEARKFGDSE